MTLSLAGVFPPVTTPFTVDGDLALAELRTMLGRMNALPLSGYVLGGSNGEFVSLSLEERLAVTELAREVTPADRVLIGGTGMESTRATIALTKQVAALGVDAVMVVTPGYFKARMSATALEAHYRAVADASPVPVMLYSVPANTGVELPQESVAKLSEHPNIIGLKDSGGDITRIGWMVGATRPGFQVLAGSAGFLLPALAVGAVGTVAALANIAARELAALVEQFRAGDLVGARELQWRLIEANSAVTRRFGVAGLKAAQAMLGWYGGPPRAPLLPLSEAETTELRKILVSSGLLAA
ncbi:MAG TPA: dihydrodipicolinate synthase family protein [Gemmatimonadales bacterium]|nr:dihydrodipicolinate synthase family protein [Gemmatimonadales bacterium]